MEIKEITTTISKKIGQPEYGSFGLTASVTVTTTTEDSGDAFREAWSICNEEIEKQEKELKDMGDIKSAASAANIAPEATRSTQTAVSTPNGSTAPVCGNHYGVAMVWKPAGVSKKTGKPYAGFYSCPMKNPDGSFCSFKPNMGAN